MSIRNAAVAGSFYPANKVQLFSDVNTMLTEKSSSEPHEQEFPLPKALILPHAGYIYSGAVAAKGYRLIHKYQNEIKKIILLGPSHRVAFRGIALPEDNYFATPLGTIALDREGIKQLQALPFVFQSTQAHFHEHSLEVQLPFLQVQLDDFSIVPLVVGDASAAEVAEVIATFLGLPDVLVIISTDLSHFLDYQQAQEIDEQTSQLICNKYSHIKGEQACGSRPLNGMLKLASKKNLQIEALAVCNSGDTAGDKSSVVGYGAYVIY